MFRVSVTSEFESLNVTMFSNIGLAASVSCVEERCLRSSKNVLLLYCYLLPNYI